VWVARAPLRFLGMQLGRNMAVVRLRDGDLLVHFPAPLSDELRRALDQLAIPSASPGRALRICRSGLSVGSRLMSP
jgi:hypothetical protein